MLLARSPTTDLRVEKADRMGSVDDLDAATLHRRYLREIFRYVSRRVPRQEAEDVTMHVLGAALEALPRFRGECPPHVWLLGIAHRKVVDALRHAELSWLRELVDDLRAGRLTWDPEAVRRALASGSRNP